MLAGVVPASASAPESRMPDRIVFEGLVAGDSLARQGLRNPGRGFRLETAVDVVKDRERADAQLLELATEYASDSVALAQSYFYLGGALGRSLSDEDFAVMQRYFDRLRELGMKSVLRFAYERDFMGRASDGPTLRQALEHLDELAPFLAANRDLILVVQAGVIGAWGEWHSSVHGLEYSEPAQRAILEKLLEIVPEELQVQVRVPDYKNILRDRPELYRRLSFHDDFIVIRPNRWDGNMHEGTPNFEQMVRESPDLIVDGELPWGFWSVGGDPDAPDSGWLIDGRETARRLFLQHYTSLSVIHNYKERHAVQKEDQPTEFSMIRWKRTPIDPEYLVREGMPFSEDYFRDAEGHSALRSEFEYVRDHLGYRLELQEMQYTRKMQPGQCYPVRVTLINRGFATVFGRYEVRFALIDSCGRVVGSCATDADCRAWQPYEPGDPTHTPKVHAINGVLDPALLPGPGCYRLGLWIADASERLRMDPRYAIRCANRGLPWWVSADGSYGMTILGEVEIPESDETSF